MYRSATAVAFTFVLLGIGATDAFAEKVNISGTGQFTIPAWFKNSFLDMKEDAAEATAQGKRLLVYIGQDGCPYCAALFNTNFSQKHIVDYTRKHFDAIEINLWGDRSVKDFSGETLSEKAFGTKLKVWFTPTILFFNGDGRLLLRINGYYAPRQFFAALRYVAERREKSEPFQNYLARVASQPATGGLYTENFYEKAPFDLRMSVPAKPLAVFFEQADCAGCEDLHRIVFRQPATLEQLKRLRVVQIDRWSNTPVVTPNGARVTARAWADQLNVSYVPTAVFFDRGKEVIRIEAMLKSFHVQSVMDYVASGAYQRQPSFQRFIRSRADRLRQGGVPVDLWR